MIPTDLVEIVHRLEDILDRIGIARSYGGALSYNFWAPPRLTQDVDLLLLAPDTKVPALVEALQEAGCLHGRAPARPIDLRAVLSDLRSKERLVVFLWGKTPLDLFVPWHPFHHRVLARSVERDFEGRRIRIHQAEDLIVFKKVFDRPKDLADIQAMLAVQKGRLDLDRLLADAAELLSHEKLEELRKTVSQYGT